MASPSPIPVLSFSFLIPPTTRFGPRLGTMLLRRPEGHEIKIQTPGFLTSTSRGVIPHLSRDQYGSNNIRWVNIPFESFLDVLPPIPTLAPGRNPLHSFLGYSLGQHVVSLSARDPADGREMPSNGNAYVSAYSLQGVRKVAPADWKSYTSSCKPDLVFALSDTPFTNPPYSQKRLTKSIERSASWLANLISGSVVVNDTSDNTHEHKPNVLVHMAGATSIEARRAFAQNLVEKQFGPDAETIKPLETLDQGVFGYAFDLVPIRLSLEAAANRNQNPSSSSLPQTKPPAKPPPTRPLEVYLDPVVPAYTDQLFPLLQASLEPLPITKLRVVNTVQTPHDILRLISVVGIDLFDSYWAQRAADTGIALDFEFPVPSSSINTTATPSSPQTRETGKHDIGHNLYSSSYAHDFSSFSSSSNSCTCLACAPLAPSTRIYHGFDETYSHQPEQRRTKPAFTRAYIHHLLHTHEMSAHSLLVLHNLSVLDDFFSGICRVLHRCRSHQQDDPPTHSKEDVTLTAGEGHEEGNRRDEWEVEVQRFCEYYDETLKVFEEAKVMWRDVDLARGKGRLAREKKRQEDSLYATVEA